MIIYILALYLLSSPTLPSIISFIQIPNCQRKQFGPIGIKCVECISGFKLMNDSCIKCGQGDQHYQCLEDQSFEYGSISRNTQKPLYVKYEIQFPIKNMNYGGGSSLRRKDESTQSVDQRVSQNRTELIEIPQSQNETELENNDGLNLTENLTQIEDETEINKTLEDHSEIKYVEYHKQFKTPKVQISMQSERINLIISENPQILNLITLPEPKLFVIEEKFLNYQNNFPSHEDLCLEWMDQEQSSNVCLKCIEGYVPSGFSYTGNLCKKINRQVEISGGSSFKVDPNCKVISYFGKHYQGKRQMLCDECQPGYRYSMKDGKCIQKDRFCLIYNEWLFECSKCVEGFEMDSEKQACIQIKK